MSRRWLVVVVALLLAAVPASADPEAEAVRDKVRAAVGYEAFRRMEHGVLIEGKTEDFSGAAVPHRWHYHHDGRYVRVTESKAGQYEGFDGKTRWYGILANPALPVELINGTRQRLRHAIVAHHWLSPTGGYTADIDAKESRPYRPCVLVRHPDCPGAAAQVYIDPETWLPTHFTVIGMGSASVVELSDYRNVGGVKVAGRVAVDRYSRGQEFVATTAVAAPPPQPGKDPFAPVPPTDTRFAADGRPGVEAQAAKHFLLVRPVINGRAAGWFAVQTGVSVSCIAAAEAERLGLPVLGRRPAPGAGGFPFQIRPTDQFGLGPATFAGLGLLELEDGGMASVSRLAGVEVRGLLGNDILSRVVLETSWSGGTVAVHDSVGYRAPAGIVWQPARFDTQIPYITATFEGRHTGLFGLSTGNWGLTFGPVATRSLRLLAGRAVETEQVTAVESVVPASRGVGAEFRVFDHPLKSVGTRFLSEDDGAERYPYALGTFGPAALGPGTLVFDYPNRRIGFVPRP